MNFLRLIQFMFVMLWERVPVKDICDVLDGKCNKARKKNDQS
jgi:hypothetical protein